MYIYFETQRDIELQQCININRLQLINNGCGLFIRFYFDITTIKTLDYFNLHIGKFVLRSGCKVATLWGGRKISR